MATTENFKAPGKFMAVMQQKCPRCRKGPIFKHPSFSTRFIKMNEDCPVCGLHFEIEPGFFWGAMYISYAITVGIGIVVAILIYNLLNDPDVLVYLGILFGVLIFLSPVIFRYSRVLMLYLFGGVKYDAMAGKGIKK